MHVFRTAVRPYPMKNLIDRRPVLKAFQERTRKALGNRKLDVMTEADLEKFVDTIVISNTVGTTDRNASASAGGRPRRRTARPALRK